jgi:hypothetical protein
VLAGWREWGLLVFAWPWVLVLAAAPFVGRNGMAAHHRRTLLPPQRANMRELPGPRPVELGATTRARAALPRRFVGRAYASAVVGLVLTVGSLDGGPLSIVVLFIAPASLIGLVLLVAGVVGVVGVGMAFGMASALRNLARDWEAWEDAYDVLVVREPVRLERGHLLRPRAAFGTPVWRTPLRWPPAQAGVGWYWVRRDQVRPGEVG